MIQVGDIVRFVILNNQLRIGVVARLESHRGITQAAGHIDGIMYKPTLTLDQTTVLRDGEVLIER